MIDAIRKLNYWLAKHDLKPDQVEITIEFPDIGVRERAKAVLSYEMDPMTMFDHKPYLDEIKICSTPIKLTTRENTYREYR